MKKFYLFVAMATMAVTGCSDDNNDNTNGNLTGVWIETAPNPDAHKINFSTSFAIITKSNSSGEILDYNIDNDILYFNLPGSTSGVSAHRFQRVDASTITLSNMYPQTTEASAIPIITTFVKQ